MPLEATFVKHSGTKIAGKRSSTHIAFLFEVFLDAVSHLLQRGVPGFRLLSQFSLQPLNVLQPHKSILRLPLLEVPLIIQEIFGFCFDIFVLPSNSEKHCFVGCLLFTDKHQTWMRTDKLSFEKFINTEYLTPTIFDNIFFNLWSANRENY